ncbi:MAG: PEP-CTERM sorting domain-containing protein [Planctomycetes bacterium]|nr:PEP-CTERM sorting domain-containing protein [Planctomycetota bacterium]
MRVRVVTAVLVMAGFAVGGSFAMAGPLGLGGNVLWLDASDVSTITDTGGLVDQWNDKSTAGNNFTGTGNERPTTGASTQNGLNVITFDNDYLVGPNAVLGGGDDDYTYYAVWQPNRNAVLTVYEQGQGNDQRSSILAVNAAYGFNGQGNDKHDLVPYAPNQWRVMDMKVDNSLPDGTNNIYLVDNDTPYVGRTGNPANLNIGANGSRVGAKVQNNAERMFGDIAEILVYDRALNDAERLQVRDYLDEKYALNDFAPPAPATFGYDFQDGTGTPDLDGWTIISQGNAGQPQIQSARSEANRLLTAPVLTTAFGTPVGGFIGDNGHNTLIAQSPAFEITAAGEITWQSVGGNAGGAVDPGTGTGAYPGNAMGVSLVRASDGDRVLSVETAQEGSVTGYSFDVTPFVNDGNSYYLEVVDNLSGGWGYVEWDTFWIPTADRIALMDPQTNDGSFESNTITTNHAPTTLPPVWTITETGTGGVLGPGHDARFKSDGSRAMFSDSGITTATSMDLLGTNGYDSVSEGDLFDWSFDFNSWGSDSGGTLELDFGNGAVLLGTGLSDGDIGTYHTISGTYTATAADAAGGQLVLLAHLNRGAGNAYADNVRLTVIAAAVPEPSTFVLAVLGLLGLAWYGRRRRK